MSATKSSPAQVLSYRFGPYEADISRNELRKFGLRVRLERKPWQLLIALLQRSGELVGRVELQRAVWAQDVFVDFEHGLNVAVKKLRTALNDSAEAPVYIETVAGEGYRFVADVKEVIDGTPATIPSKPIPHASVPYMPVAVTPDLPSEQENQAAHPAGSVRQPWLRSRKVWSPVGVTVGVALVAVMATTLAWRRPGQREPARAGKIVLVVLPFANLSGDPGQEYFSDGMTEELSAHLGNLSPQRLSVIGRTSAMTYKQSRKTISEIGKELAVDYVLEGSVRREGKRLRVTAQLVQASGQTHIWAEAYDREVRDLLQMEDELAREIARQIGISIALDPPTRSASHHTPDPQAHEAYILGRYHWNKRTPEGWATGERYFRRAIEIDAQYAVAYAGLAECRIPAQEAQAMARKAVELDPASGEVLTALGWVELYRNLDLAAAEGALKTAVQLDPNYAPAHHTYSAFLEFAGRFQEAIREERQAVFLDPLAHISRASLAGLLSVAGQYDRGEEQIRLIFAMDPQFPKAHETLGRIYLRKGMYRKAILEFQTSEQNGGDRLLGLLGYAYARSGDSRQALRMLYELQELGKRSPSGGVSYDLALVEIGLGNRDKALAWLQKAYLQHDDDGLLYLKYEPILDPLRPNPRFQDLLRSLNFLQ